MEGISEDRPATRRRWVFLLLVVAVAAPATARTLYWSSLDVDAKLDADGRLLVVERQTMVFDGDWNGGERTFRLFPGQRLELHGVVRSDPATGASTRLERGSVDLVDHYDWQGRNVLRWRSRLPSDPHFSETTIVYELYYTLSGALAREGERYRLDHDFAFADRVGPIERFALDLTLDPAWKTLITGALEVNRSAAGERLHLERGELAPGQTVVVDLTLARTVDSSPSGVRRNLAGWQRQTLAAATVVAIALLIARFAAFERRQGRYAKPVLPDPPTRSWLDEHLFSLAPEEAGALWDQTVGRAEVSALLARWIAEGRLASSVREPEGRFRPPVLELELLAERESFAGYERRLIDKLFFGGRRRTDTEAVREHYKLTGFSPVATIKSDLARRVRELPGLGRPPAPPRAAPTAWGFLAVAVGFVLEAVLRGFGGAAPAIALLMVVMMPAIPLGYLFAWVYRQRPDGLGPFLILFLLPPVAGASLVVAMIALGARFPLPQVGEVGLFGTLALALFLLAVFRSILNLARTRTSKAAVYRRRQLAAARRSLRRELDKPAPDLEDTWIPYLLAFGLERGLDRWGRAFGGRGGADASSTVAGGGGSISSPVRGWTGGGAFGGAGATAAWTAAASSLASGVSPPGSSGSGGGSSGGGSSGGGGGGGW